MVLIVHLCTVAYTTYALIFYGPKYRFWVDLSEWLRFFLLCAVFVVFFFFCQTRLQTFTNILKIPHISILRILHTIHATIFFDCFVFGQICTTSLLWSIEYDQKKLDCGVSLQNRAEWLLGGIWKTNSKRAKLTSVRWLDTNGSIWNFGF